MPLQSGSDAVLRAMRRSYRSSKFLGILDRVREAMPDAAITTDVIVGFPGETDEDFEDTLRVVEAARFASAYTFQYSPRPGTPAFELPSLDHAVVQERYVRLHALQQRISLEENQRVVGRTVEVMVLDAGGRKDDASARLTGRSPDNRLVHFTVPESGPAPRPGDMATVDVTYAAPHHLVADGALAGGTYAVRRTRAGDVWDAVQAGEHAHGVGGCGDTCGTPSAAGPVGLGIPMLRRD
jgi:tRNA-2-methylthio-N6-dimethylallyladenosine synthase